LRARRMSRNAKKEKVERTKGNAGYRRGLLGCTFGFPSTKKAIVAPCGKIYRLVMKVKLSQRKTGSLRAASGCARPRF
jgi:hypothetical protein